MHLPRSAALAPLLLLDHAGSTNDELRSRAGRADDFTVVLTFDQRSGRGRLGRSWVAPPGTALAASVLLRPRLPGGAPLPVSGYGWLPLLAGLAMARAVNGVLAEPAARVKWPNDVLVSGRKVCGLLAEALPDGAGLILGSGVNLGMSEERLPTPTATSLGLEGAVVSGDELADRVLAGYLGGLRSLLDAYLAAGADATASGLRREVAEQCETLGRSVRVELPGGRDVLGTALGIDPDGRLEVRPASGGDVVAVAAGDVTHVRPAEPDGGAGRGTVG